MCAYRVPAHWERIDAIFHEGSLAQSGRSRTPVSGARPGRHHDGGSAGFRQRHGQPAPARRRHRLLLPLQRSRPGGLRNLARACRRWLAPARGGLRRRLPLAAPCDLVIGEDRGRIRLAGQMVGCRGASRGVGLSVPGAGMGRLWPVQILSLCARDRLLEYAEGCPDRGGGVDPARLPSGSMPALDQPAAGHARQIPDRNRTQRAAAARRAVFICDNHQSVSAGSSELVRRQRRVLF